MSDFDERWIKPFATHCSGCGGVLYFQSIRYGEEPSMFGVVTSRIGSVRTSFAKWHNYEDEGDDQIKSS